jgi:hypothetical protein
MSDNRSLPRPGTATPTGAGVELDDPMRALRTLASRAHQLRAATTAADRFIARDGNHDRDTGSWLISAATTMATELTGDIDSLARGLKERPADAAVLQTVSNLRVRAHQLSAATRAADHFLDQDNREDRDTGSWLVATALGLAQKLAAEMEDGASATRRPGSGQGDKGVIEPHRDTPARRGLICR